MVDACYICRRCAVEGALYCKPKSIIELSWNSESFKTILNSPSP